MQFSNPIVASGGELVRDRIRSSNYAAGVSGWQISRDGSAELNNATIRGTLQSSNFVTGVSGWRLLLSGAVELLDATIRGTLQSSNFVAGSAGWRLLNTGAAELNSAVIRGKLSTLGTDTEGIVIFHDAGGSRVLLHSGCADEDVAAKLINEKLPPGDREQVVLQAGRIDSMGTSVPAPSVTLYTGDGTAGDRTTATVKGQEVLLDGVELVTIGNPDALGLPDVATAAVLVTLGNTDGVDLPSIGTGSGVVPSTPPAGTSRLFTRVNNAGKTVLAVKWPDGNVTTLGTSP